MAKRNKASMRVISQALFLVSEVICSIDFVGGKRERVLPDSIPNPEVKPLIADGTAHKSVEELSRRQLFFSGLKKHFLKAFFFV